MHLSPSEFFILGRIISAWRVSTSLTVPPYWGGSLMATAEHIFHMFGIDHTSPPARWSDVERRVAPGDTAWKKVDGWKPRFQPLGHADGIIPGVPCGAMGVSPSTPERLFVERVDAETCAWIIERPVSGLYLVIMRWLRRWAGVSPQLWLVMHLGPWPATVEEWLTLPEFVRTHPHVPFAADAADGVAEAAINEARESGCETAFLLGSLSAEVEARLACLTDMAQQADAFRRQANDYLGNPDDNLQAILADAMAAMSHGGVVDEVCRFDDGAIGFYALAHRDMLVDDGPLGGTAAISRAIAQAHSRTLQASVYLYGRVRARSTHDAA